MIRIIWQHVLRLLILVVYSALARIGYGDTLILGVLMRSVQNRAY
jgi:hypothetical protein